MSPTAWVFSISNRRNRCGELEIGLGKGRKPGMNRIVKIGLALLLVAMIGGAYWYGRVQGGRVGPGRAAAGNLVQNVAIETEHKTESGAVYGDFSVVVRVKNTTSEALRQLKIVCQQVHTPSQDLLGIPKVETKLLTLAEIKPGGEHTIRFSGFKAQPPNEQQEIVVNIIGYSGLGKLPYKAAAAPAK